MTMVLLRDANGRPVGVNPDMVAEVSQAADRDTGQPLAGIVVLIMTHQRALTIKGNVGEIVSALNNRRAQPALRINGQDPEAET